MQKARRKPLEKKPSLRPLRNVHKPHKLPPVPSEFSFKLPEESWWLPTQPPMDVSAEQPGLGSSPPGPQLELHPLPLSLGFLSSPLPSFLPSFPFSSFPPLSLPPLFFLSALTGRSRQCPHLPHELGRQREREERGYTPLQGDRERNEGEKERENKGGSAL